MSTTNFQRLMGLLLLGAGVVLIALAARNASAATLTVDDDGNAKYTKIQDAIDAAGEGDTIRVWEGTYEENVVVDKTVNLVGNGSEETTIDGGGSDVVVKITVDWVNIREFHISNGNYGIYLLSSSNCAITDNTCSSNTEEGIYLSSSSYNSLENNTMNENGISIVGSSLENWNLHTIKTTNAVNGKPVYYYKNVSGFTVPSGAGQVILANCTWINVENQNCSNGSVGILVGYSSNITITNNTCSSNYYGIRLRSSSDCTITDNTCEKNNYGIFLWNSSDCTITDNTCSSNSGFGISLYYSSDCTLANNTASSNNHYGIWLEDSSNGCTLANNTCENNYYGIYFSSHNCMIADNTCISNTKGIYISSSSNWNTLENNTCSSNTEEGIYISFSRYNTLKNNTCESNQGGDIHLYYSHYCEIMGNTINGNGIVISGWLEYWDTHFIDTTNMVNGKIVYYFKNTTGISIPMDAGQIILANCSWMQVENQNCSNILVGHSSNITITNNTCSSNGSKGIYLSSSSYNTLENNLCSSNNNDGITLWRSNYNTLKNNSCSSNNNDGIYLYSSSYNTLDNNSCSSNNNNGIYLSYSNYNTLDNNSCSSNNNDGIYFWHSRYNTLDNNSCSSNNNSGIFLNGSRYNTLENNTILENANGIHLRDSSSGNIAQDNHIYHNSEYGINATDNNGYTVDARFNWWGDPSGPYHPSHNSEGKGDNITDDVQFDPWLEVKGYRPPMAFIDSVSPNPALEGESILLTGHGMDNDGYVVRYVWRTEEEELYNGTESSFTLSDLSIGTHIISLKVMDNDGIWSESVEVNMTVLLDRPKWQTGDCWKWRYVSGTTGGKEEVMLITEEVMNINATYNAQDCYELKVTLVTSGEKESGKIWLSKDDFSLLGHDFRDLEPAGSFLFLSLLTLPVDVSEGNDLFSCWYQGIVPVGDNNFTCYNFTGKYSEAWIMYSADGKHIVKLDFPTDDGYVRIEMEAAFDPVSCYDYGELDEDNGGGDGFIPGFGAVAMICALGLGLIFFHLRRRTRGMGIFINNRKEE